LLLGAVVALVGALVVYLLLANTGGSGRAAEQPTPTPEIVKVVAARGDLPAYTVLDSDKLQMVDVDKTTVLTTTARTFQEVNGKMITVAYKNNDVISKDAETLQDPGISRIVTKGQRAFGFPVQEINTFNQGINDNDRVDVVWSREFKITDYVQPPSGAPPEKVEGQAWTTKTLLQNVRVLKVVSLQVGKKSSGQVVNASGGQEGDAEQKQQQAIQAAYAEDAPPAMLLILEITDQQAEVVKFARENGKVDLALRAADDNDVERTTGITDKILVEDYGVVLPELVRK
jgi:Flp pilus assembly protein CpaB